MGVAVSTKFFKRGHQDKKVGNHCSKRTFNGVSATSTF